MTLRKHRISPTCRFNDILGLAVCAAVLGSGCAGSAKTETSATVAPVIGDAGTPDDASMPPANSCPPSNPYCGEATAPDAGTGCGNAPVDLQPAGVNIMVAVDGAASMSTHWPRIKDAIKALRDAHPDADMGIQVFWGELVQDVTTGFQKNNWCGDTKNNVLEPGTDTAQQLADFLGAAPPGPNFVGGLWETSPVIEPLNYYLENATKLSDPEKTNYLIFITNGNDNCFGSVFAQQTDKLLAYEKLAVELGKRKIRILPIGFDASAQPGSTGALGTVNGNTDLDVLSTLLKFGGTGLTDVPKVDDPTKFGDVLTQVGEAARNCRFVIPDALDSTKGVNAFQLEFSVNGHTVTRDRLEKDGWNFVDGNSSQVEMFGQSCEAVRTGGKVEARKTCATNVCGSASIKVETKARAVLFVFDVSASRIECTDGTNDCQVPPQLVMRPSVTYWEAVGHAMNEVLVAPINDDIEFGIQFFPSKSSGTLSCDVAAQPEVAPADGTEITIMSEMLEKLPFGSSPLLQALENVSKAPGRLADPDVEGAVVLLSAGGDSCSGLDQTTLDQQLGAAAKTLMDGNVKTYVVRYGSDADRTPNNEAQLRAIVANGGTASSDPADTSKIPYVDAKDDTQLNAALASISNTLATCSFALGGLPADADKTNTNIYVNGVVIPFDQKHAGKDGWDWTDKTQTAVQLYGDSCETFKTNRKTSVVVELGCAPVVIF